jgi:glycosyltransferase involved in cell wall biosynthesis
VTAGGLDLACVIPILGPGGAERVLTGLANDLSARGHRISILTLMRQSEPAFYPLDPDIELLRLGAPHATAETADPLTLVRNIRRIRRALKRRRFDLVLGFATLGNILALAASRGLGQPVVAAERVDPQAHGQHIGRARVWLRDTLYARADHVVVQTARARRGLSWLPDARVSCIVNPVHPVASRARPDAPGSDGRWRILAAGRLEHQKGFDRLLAAFSRLADAFPSWDMVIYGEGPERAKLEAEIARMQLADRISLPGVTADLERELVLSHVMAFPSRYEGFPNALAEGLAAGLPAVGFADVSGVEELVIEGETGLLATPEAPVDSLVGALRRLLTDPALRVRLGAGGRAHVAGFSPRVHTDRWEAVLVRLATAGR